jgi:hypothetical protein
MLLTFAATGGLKKLIAIVNCGHITNMMVIDINNILKDAAICWVVLELACDAECEIGTSVFKGLIDLPIGQK